MAHVRRNKRNKDDVLIDAEFRIRVEKIFHDFSSSNNSSFTFPALLSNVERAFVHNTCHKFNLKSKSHGFGENRRLSLYKLIEDENFVHQSAKFHLSSESQSVIKQYLKQNPMPSSQKHSVTRKADIVNHFQPFALTCPPIVPPKNNQSDHNIQSIRRNLSIHEYREKIMQAIDTNRILLVQGSTGSGKTTQIPQYIMEAASERNEPCRILCTQPRRISAIASAERVCYERGIQLGSTVGYQIRLDSQISATSNCIFLTPGVFLRYLMGRMPEKLFANLTHIIIDESHERAKENDFLLTSIKEHFNVNPKLKLIIMSATMDTSIFSNYFGGCDEISISTKQFNVDEYYLEDVLKIVGFTNRKVQELNAKYQSGQLIQASNSAFINDQSADDENIIHESDFDEEFKCYLDDLLEKMSTHDNPECYFDEFLYYVINENVPVNYRHRQTKMTPLMIAIGRDWEPMVEKLLQNKADQSLKVDFGGYELSAIEIAEKLHGSDSKVKDLLLNFNSQVRSLSNDERYNKALLNIYQDSMLKTKTNNFVVEESIDHDLIVQLVAKIHNGTDKDGAILIFLPGFDDIMQLSKLINETIRHDYTLFLLHSSMRTDDQKNVFRPTAYGKRKIILSTNIAESSITIDDVIYVIDSGREKQKSYDAISHSSSLRVQWISKASANQRRGRAGRLRNGIVYRIYSRDRFKSMLDVAIPELLRTSLTEICLQSKLLIDEKTKIEEFLQKCIASPSLTNIRQSVKYLQKMGALDSDENLTLLGSNLVLMPIEAKYAKMLINSIIFKCLDPVLSIVSILTMGDQVFTLPINPGDRYKCEKWRKSVAENSYSDHFLMLKIFNQFLHLKQNNQNEKKFCEENFISIYHIEQVRGIRNQISNYLHSSGLVKDNSVDLNINSDKWPVIKAVIASGLYPFVARVERKKGIMYTEIDSKLTFHMSSVMSMKREGYKQAIKKLPVDWVVFEEKNRVGRMAMLKCNTLLSNVAMSLVSGFELKEDKIMHVENAIDDDEWEDDDDDDDDEEDDEDENYLNMKIDNFIKFFTCKDDSLYMLALREQLNALILRFLSEKNFKATRNENTLIDILTKIIETEDLISGFSKLSVIGNIQIPNASINQMNSKQQQNYQTNSKYSGNQRNQNSNNAQRPYYADNQDSRNSIRQQQQHADGNNWRSQKDRNYSNDQTPQTSTNWRAQKDDNKDSRNSTNQHRKMYANSNQAGSHSNNWRSQNQSNNQYGKRSRTVQNQFQPPSSYQKFIVVKMNSQKFVDSLKARTVCNLIDLNLKIWMFHKIAGLVKKDVQVHIIFFSTITKSFLGYGEVSVIDEQSPLQFHLRYVKNVTIGELGKTKFAQDIAHPLLSQSFHVHELDDLAGNSLIIYFQS